MKYLHKYAEAAYPYEDLVKTNAKRTRFESEYELIDTGVFDADRYFDVFVEYCKAAPEDILIRITAANRGTAGRGVIPAAASLVPQHLDRFAREQDRTPAAVTQHGWSAVLLC